MNWIFLVVIAQFFLAIVALIDKYILVAKKVEKPFVLAFYVSSLTIFSLFIFTLEFIPLPAFLSGINFPSASNIGRPTAGMIAMTFVAGFTFFQALISLYSAFRQADVSDVVPVVGSVSAVATFLLSYLINDDVLSAHFATGFIFLVIGTVLISKLRLKRDVVFLSIHAGILFAFNATMMKSMFAASNFDHAFFWSRMGTIIIMLIILLVPRYFRKITENDVKTKAESGLWVLGKTAIAGIASFLILKSIELGDVTLVQALGGLQFVFLAMISFFLGHITPSEFGENNKPKDVIQKSIGITIVLVGFFYLFI